MRIGRRITYCLWLLAGLFAVACSPGVTTSSGSYNEDLSHLRPVVPELPVDSTLSSAPEKDITIIEDPIDPEYDVTSQVNAVLDSIDVLREEREFIDGFTVLVYSGGSSKEANNIKSRIFTLLDDARPKLQYQEPNFRVKVGSYYSKLEAQKTFVKLAETFPKAIVIPERIPIDK